MTCVFCHDGSLSVVEATYLGRTLMPWETGSPLSWCGQYGSQISQVRRPSRNASARSNQEVRKVQSSSSACAAVQPPRSNPPRRSSSGPPGPWYTPSRVSIIEAVSFMVSAPSQRVDDGSPVLLRQLDDDPLGTAEVAEPVDALVLLHLADELGAVRL